MSLARKKKTKMKVGYSQIQVNMYHSAHITCVKLYNITNILLVSDEMNLTGGPSGKNAGFTCGATGALGNPGTIPVIQRKGLTLHPLGRLSSSAFNKT